MDERGRETAIAASDGYELEDRGDCRVLTVGGQPHSTAYSERVVRMLVDRKGPRRAALYFAFKETRGRHFLAPLWEYLGRTGARGLSVLEIGCSFGHMTECLAGTPLIAEIHAFDTDPAFVAIVQAKTEEMGLEAVREVRHLTAAETCHLPWPDARFDLVLACGVVEHLPARHRRVQVDEYYRVLAPGGHIAILDTPNRLFPLETHSVGLPLVQWMPEPLAYRYARLGRPRRFRTVPYGEFIADGTGWRNASLRDCLPSTGWAGLEDVTERAGYGWRFFCQTARSPTRRALLPLLWTACRLASAVGSPPSVCLPYLNLLFRRA